MYKFLCLIALCLVGVANASVLYQYSSPVLSGGYGGYDGYNGYNTYQTLQQSPLTYTLRSAQAQPLYYAASQPSFVYRSLASPSYASYSPYGLSTSSLGSTYLIR